MSSTVDYILLKRSQECLQQLSEAMQDAIRDVRLQEAENAGSNAESADAI